MVFRFDLLDSEVVGSVCVYILFEESKPRIDGIILEASPVFSARHSPAGFLFDIVGGFFSIRQGDFPFRYSEPGGDPCPEVR